MSREEVMKTALDWFKGDDMKANIWVDKYCLQDSEGNYLEATPDDMFKRLTREFLRIERKYKNPLTKAEIHDLLDGFKYVIPGGSILYGLGNDNSHTSLGNCFVIGSTVDSYGNICKTDQEQVQLMKRRGGVGHDLSHLRARGTRVNNAANTSTGAVSFMHRYSNSTREVAQGGRRGALMLTMNVHHPDVIEFIESKSDLSKLTGCNISVKVNNAFMEAVKADDYYTLDFGFKAVKARSIWDKLIHQSWATAEPGVLFWDTIINNSPADRYPGFKSVSTNPCGEIPLCPYDTCRLMSLNMFSFVNNPFTELAEFDHGKFNLVTMQAQKLMDDVIDLENEKIEAILKKISDSTEPADTWETEYNLWIKVQEKLLMGRRTGLSCIGLADCLAAVNLKYGSPESLEFIDKVFAEFNNAAYASSELMANDRGAFPAWNSKIDPAPRRNIALLTIPPSGTISIMADVTSGIEPVYALEYKRRRKVEISDKVAFVDAQGDKWEEYKVYHPKYEEYGKPASYIGCTAPEIDPKDRVRLQATIQKHIDHSISSTINLPSTATEEQISELYMLAWELGCKGLTVYRDGCRDGVLISKDQKPAVKQAFMQHSATKRPRKLNCNLTYSNIKGEKFCMVVGLLEEKPYEIFAFNVNNETFLLDPSYKYCIVKVERGKYNLTSEDESHTYCVITEKLTDEQAAITRLISTSLRHGASIKFIVEQLNKIDGDLTSFSKVLARTLKKYIKEGETMKGLKCDVCNGELTLENGCMICKGCGSSKCG